MWSKIAAAPAQPLPTTPIISSADSSSSASSSSCPPVEEAKPSQSIPQSPSVEASPPTVSDASPSAPQPTGLLSNTKANIAVLDTGAFIGGQKLEELGDKLCTVQEVIREIRDEKARQRLESGVNPVEVREPSPDALKAVSAFARKTGDLHFLSKTDLKVMALTYQLHVERNGKDKLRTEPVQPKRPAESAGGEARAEESSSELADAEEPTLTEAEASEPERESEHSVIEATGSEAELHEAETTDAPISTETTNEPEPQADTGKSTSKGKSKVYSPIPSMAGGWITPQNLKKTQKKDLSALYGSGHLDVKLDVVCFTRDFSMQNVLMQIGLSVMSEEGLLIRRARRWALRCFTCNKPERNTSKIFCQHCGNNTLRRISMVVNDDGTVYYSQLHYTPSKRGSQFIIPPPRAGRKATTYVTSEDQLAHFRKAGRPRDQNVFDPDYQFAGGARQEDFRSKKIVIVGQGRKNPNESRKRVNKKKKRTSAL